MNIWLPFRFVGVDLFHIARFSRIVGETAIRAVKMTIGFDAKAFLAAKAADIAGARQRAALQLSCGLDLDIALASGGEARQAMVARVERELRRMRHAALKRHWSYDLNRHIALRQVLDRLNGDTAPKPIVRPKRRRRGRLAATAPSES